MYSWTMRLFFFGLILLALAGSAFGSSSVTTQPISPTISSYLTNVLTSNGVSIYTGVNNTALTQAQASSIYQSVNGKVAASAITLGINKTPQLINITQNITYGQAKQSGSYVAPNNALYYVGIQNESIEANNGVSLGTNTTLTRPQIIFYKYNINKASSAPCISVNLEPVPFCSNSTSPQPIHVPIINGQYGLTGLNYYPLNITFSANLLNSNNAQFNFSVIDITNGTQLIPLSTTASRNNLSIKENFKIGISQEIEITFDSQGDANYSKVVDDPITIPSNLLWYIPVNILNLKNQAFQANSEIPIPYNGLNYTNYESKSLNNTEFFWFNGTIIPSWLEGNTMNENSLANTLYQSANVLFWVRLPPSNTFLPANSGSVGANTIYLGFASTTTNLFTNTITGEAPQLSCYNPTNTITGCQSGVHSYGYLDDGLSVFPFYDNFHGTTLNTSDWVNTGTLVYTVANSILVSGIASGGNVGVNSLTFYNPNNDIIDFRVNNTQILAETL